MQKSETDRVSPISQRIWDMKYRLKTPGGKPLDQTIPDSWRRVAKALAAPEADPTVWEDRFYRALEDFRFLPAGRILSGAGSGRNVTLFNCFVMGDVPDDMPGIFGSLREAALTMQRGGGIGYNFSTLRPQGAPVKGVGATASGPLSFMDVWDSMCRTIMSAGSRRGAMMAAMSCDHPDIEAFIKAKREAGRLRMFNLSVLVTDAFMRAVKDDAAWELIFDGVVYKSLPARELWGQIMQGAYAYAEPGIIFIDRVNALNNLNYCETIHGSNPCGEQPLPPYGACLLGSINLARLVESPFSQEAGVNIEELFDLTATAVRMMDNVIDVSNLPLPQQEHEAKSKRRIGLGVTGLADALIMCGARYGSSQAVALTEKWMQAIKTAAYRASARLAKEKGPFPLFDAEKYLAAPMVRKLDEKTRNVIAEHGVRNALLTSVAPTGTISLYADNVSSGLEPAFSFKYSRHVLMPNGERREEEVIDYAYRLFRRLYGQAAPLPDAFVDAQELTPRDHLVMQAAVQEHVDSSISKTINVPESIAFEDFQGIYTQAYELGCKGCTAYRPNDITGAVLTVKKEKPAAPSREPELPLGPPRPTAGVKPLRLSKADGNVGATIVHMTRPLDRPEALPGATYKVQWPESEHAMYITLNDIIDDRGRRRPFEIFINTKDVEHYAWMVGLTRMISAIFRRGGNVCFVVEELKAVFDPRGGHWMEGKYVPSLLAAIGQVIENHLIAIGFLTTSSDSATIAESIPEVAAMADFASGGGKTAPARSAGSGMSRLCPKCAQPGLIHQEGCDTCASCGYSKCG